MDNIESFNVQEVSCNEPWAQEMWQCLETSLKTSFNKWCQIAGNLSDKPDNIEKWGKHVKELADEFGCEIIRDMEERQNRCLSKIKKSKDNIVAFCNILQIDMPKWECHDLNLFDELAKLSECEKEYDKVIESFKKELKELQTRQVDVCTKLSKLPKKVPIPAQKYVESFKEHVQNLEAELSLRKSRLDLVRTEISEYLTQLRYEPTSEFERKVAFPEDEEFFLFSDRNMNFLEEFHKRLKVEFNKIKDEIFLLKIQVRLYWNLLKVEEKDRIPFNRDNFGCMQDNVVALRHEIRRLDELKKQNLKIYIDRVREDLVNIWKKCHCSEQVKEECDYFNSDCYNEDLLELHELEVTKWHKYYEDNKELLLLIEEYRKLWSQLIEFEEKDGDPDRFKNRGGQLLKIERERNRLKKRIPKAEEDLRTMAKKFEERTGNSFTTFGETISNYLENLRMERENVDKQKGNVNKTQLLKTSPNIQTLCRSTSAQTLCRATSAQNLHRTSKRKIAVPLVMDDKKVKQTLPF